MKAKHYPVLIWMLNFFITAQSQTKLMNTSYPLVKKSELQTFSFVEGRHEKDFELTNGELWSMRISIPAIKETEKYPLIIALHWAGDSESYREYSDCLAFPGLEILNAIIISPSSGGLNWSHPSNEEKLIDLVTQIRERWPVEQTKIIITGYSNGAIGAWNYIKKYPKLFNAGILMAGMYDDISVKIPLYLIHGENDELFDYGEVKETIDQSIKKEAPSI